MANQDAQNGLPQNWVLTDLSRIAVVNPRTYDNPPKDEEDVSFVPMAAVEAESGRLDASKTKPWGTVKRGYTRFQEGDVLFAKITPCMENGKFALATGLVGGRAAGSTEFHVLRPLQGVNPKLLLFFLLRDCLRQDARVRMKGAAGQLRVPPEFLAELGFPLPPEPEQRRIVAEIEKQFTRLEAAVEALKRVQANLKRYRASVLKAACEGRLVPTEAELAHVEGRDYESADKLLVRLLKERRARWEADQLAKMQGADRPPKDDKWKGKYKEPAVPDISNLPKPAEGWTWASLDQLLSFLRNGISKKPDAEEGLPILRISAVRPMKVNQEDVRFLAGNAEEFRDCILDPDDLLFTRYNGNPELTGVCGVVRQLDRVIVHPDKLIRGKVVSGPCLSRFLEISLNTGYSRASIASRVKTTAGQAGISGSDLRATPTPLPPSPEQHRIVTAVERHLSVVDELETAVEANLKRAERLRQAILKRAFEGKLVPQDPSDEPASVLLERIRDTRSKEAVVHSNGRAGTR